MRHVLVIVLSALLLVGAINANAAAFDDAIKIEVSGYAAIAEDVASAIDVAIRDAMRRGVEQTLGAYLDSYTRIENFDDIQDVILSKTRGYVSSYSIQDQRIEDDTVIVVCVLTIEQGTLRDDLDALTMQIRRKGNPRVLVVLEEQSNWHHGSSVPAESALIQTLRDHNFMVVSNTQYRSDHLLRQALNGNVSAAGRLAANAGADVFVVGTTSTYEVGVVHGLISYRSRIDVQVVDAANARVLDSLTVEEPGIDISRPAAASKASAKAGEVLSDRVVDVLVKDIINAETTISIRLSNLSFSDVQEVENRLKRTRMTNTVYMREFHNGTALFEVTTELSAMLLAGEIQNWLSTHIEITGVSGNELIGAKR